MALTKITKHDSVHREYFEYTGSPRDWMADFMREGLLQTRINTTGTDWPNLKSGSVVIDINHMGQPVHAYHKAVFDKA